ncbi:hypothetical protein N8D56_11195 [Devosia sp. A8/3-2]|nr:hypothetical protein N8D56_11195 [Devosia sp. A8/3-2]
MTATIPVKKRPSDDGICGLFIQSFGVDEGQRVTDAGGPEAE